MEGWANIQDIPECEDANSQQAILQSYLAKCVAFDTLTFSTNEPNSFGRIQWPVLVHPDKIVLADITADKVVAFCDRSTWENMGKIDKEIELILKRIAYRFHPDRFNRGRAVVRTIPSSSERELVVEAADIVIKSVNNCRRGDR
jgi:hypothetical protein